MIQPKRKVKCVICKEWFTRWNTFQKVCKNPDCIIMNANKEKEKQRRMAVKEFNESNKQWLTKIAQQTVNRYVRFRDRHLSCISCGTPAGYRQEAGHYMSSGGNGHVRFDEKNINSQCHKCNCHMSANLTNYRVNLIKKIGIEEVERLETKVVRSYSVEELKEIIETYKKKIKTLDM